MRLLIRIVRNRSVRITAVWALVLVQAEFLWLGEFHRHDEEQARHGQAVSLQDGKQASREATQRPFCVACQIGHERAASPLVGRAPAAPAVAYRLPAVEELVHSPRLVFATPSPRAPPAI